MDSELFHNADVISLLLFVTPVLVVMCMLPLNYHGSHSSHDHTKTKETLSALLFHSGTS